MPCASAATASSTSSRGANCSADALYPSLSSATPSFLLHAPPVATLASHGGSLTAITDTVHFAQTDLVNWTLVTDGNGVMLIDAGFPGQRDEVLDSVRELGFGVDDIHAILLTHAHVDHFGSAIWFAKTHGTPVFCHADEVGHAARRVPGAGVADRSRHARLAAAVPDVVRDDRPQGRADPRRHPDRPAR